MTGHTRLRNLILAAAGSIALVACGGSSGAGGSSSASGPKTIAYAAPSLADSGGQVIAKYFQAYVEKAGWKFQSVSANADATKQLADIENFITQGVSAIVVEPVDAAAVCAGVAKAKAANIPIYMIARSTTGCSVNMTVVSDNEQGGHQAGLAMVKLLTTKYGSAKGTVLEEQGDLGDNGAVLRGKGFDDVMAQNPAITVIKKLTHWKPEEFASVARDVVSTTAVDGIYWQSDSVGAPAVLPVLQEIGKLFPRGDPKHIFIVGVDGSPDMLKCISAGTCDATANQPLTDFGIVTHWMALQFQGKQITSDPYSQSNTIWSPATPKQTDVGWTINMLTITVDPSNVTDSRLWANQIPK